MLVHLRIWVFFLQPKIKEYVGHIMVCYPISWMFIFLDWLSSYFQRVWNQRSKSFISCSFIIPSHEYKGSKQTLTLFSHMFGVHCSYKSAYGSGIISQWQYTKYFEPYYDNVKSFNIVSSWWSLSLGMPIQKYAI